MRIVVLIDGLHTGELLATLSRLVRLEQADLLLAYVRRPASRTGLEMLSRRPGGHRLAPHREHELVAAEAAGSTEALAEAQALAAGQASTVEAVELLGEPGRLVCELAARRAADLVVVRAGGGDRPPMGPASTGPTARYVTDHCLCPVVLIRGN